MIQSQKHNPHKNTTIEENPEKSDFNDLSVELN